MGALKWGLWHEGLFSSDYCQRELLVYRFLLFRAYRFLQNDCATAQQAQIDLRLSWDPVHGSFCLKYWGGESDLTLALLCVPIMCISSDGLEWEKLFCWHSVTGVQSPALQRKSHLSVPILGIERPQSQFLHSCVCERFVYSKDRSYYFLQQTTV
jgi:hypothetical protein